MQYIYVQNVGNETFEKLGTIGTTNNLIIYLTRVFNMKSTTANKVLNTFNGTCSFGTLAGAFVSDTYLGRYNTICISSVSSFLVLIPSLHYLNSFPPSIKNSYINIS